MFREFQIAPYPSGFGEYQMACEGSEPYESADAILDAIAEQGIEVYELGVDELPPEAEDVRGKIHGESGRIFCHLVNGDGEMEPRYFAIAECD